MRIGYQIDRLDASRGGAETYVVRMVRRLLADGHEVHVFTGRAVDPPPGAIAHAVVPYGPDAAAAAVRSAGLDVVVGSGRCLGFDVLQPHGGTLAATWRANHALVRSPVLRGLVRAFDAVNPKPLAAAALERRQYGQASPRPRFLAVSRRVADDMIRDHGVPADRLHVVHNGVDAEAFSPGRCRTVRAGVRRGWGLPDDTVCFLLAAHNFRLKGGRELAEAAELLAGRRRGLAVVVAGRPPDPLTRLRFGGRLRFVGPVAEPITAFAAADAYVHPTWYDPCSLAVLEAWACGLPVITTRCNGAAELMTDGVEGFVLDAPSDVAGLADRMERLLDAGLRATTGAAARRLAETRTEDRHLREVTEVLAAARR